MTGNHTPETWSGAELHKVPVGLTDNLEGCLRIAIYHQRSSSHDSGKVGLAIRLAKMAVKERSCAVNFGV